MRLLLIRYDQRLKCEHHRTYCSVRAVAGVVNGGWWLLWVKGFVELKGGNRC
jgi:hypothetical protein